MLDLIYEEPKPKVYSGAKGDWELVIGMEVHAQVASKSLEHEPPYLLLIPSHLRTYSSYFRKINHARSHL